MNATEIEEAVTKLASEPFNGDEFPYDFLRAFGNKETTTKKLRSGASTKILCPLALADTGLRWHLRAYDRERGRFADFALTRIAKAKSIDQPIPAEEQIESDVQWARIVHIELVPHPGIAHPKAIESDFRMTNGVLALDMRAPLVGLVKDQSSIGTTSTRMPSNSGKKHAKFAAYRPARSKAL